MNLETQEKISKLMLEQANKLSIALQALRKIKKLQYTDEPELAIIIANNALLEISGYGKDSQNL